MHQDAHTHLAFLIGRDVAAEKALLTLIGSPRSGDALAMHELLRTNFQMGKGQLTKRLQDAGLGPEFSRMAEDGFHKLSTAVLNGVTNKKYHPPAP